MKSFTDTFKFSWKIYVLIYKFVSSLKRRLFVRRKSLDSSILIQMKENKKLSTANNTRIINETIKKSPKLAWNKKFLKEALSVPGLRSNLVTPTPSSYNEDRRSVSNVSFT